MNKWTIAIISILFIVGVCLFSGYVVSKETYKCPKCGENFKPKFIRSIFIFHREDEYLLKCPHCNKRSYVRKNQ